MENVHRMAEHVRSSVSAELRLAVVGSDDILLTLLRLTTTAVGLPTSAPAEPPVRSIAHFADVGAAAAWAQAGDA